MDEQEILISALRGSFPDEVDFIGDSALQDLVQHRDKSRAAAPVLNDSADETDVAGVLAILKQAVQLATALLAFYVAARNARTKPDARDASASATVKAVEARVCPEVRDKLISIAENIADQLDKHGH